MSFSFCLERTLINVAKYRMSGGVNQLRITTGGLLLILLLPREPQSQKLQLSPLVSNLRSEE